MVSLSRKTLRAARVAPQRCPIPRTGKRRIIIPWNEKSSIAQFAPEGLLSDLRTGCSMSTGLAAPRHWNNRLSPINRNGCPGFPKFVVSTNILRITYHIIFLKLIHEDHYNCLPFFNAHHCNLTCHNKIYLFFEYHNQFFIYIFI